MFTRSKKSTMILLLSLLPFVIHSAVFAAGAQIACSPDGFSFGEADFEAKVPGTDMTIERVWYLLPRDPGPSGLAIAFKSGEELYYLRDSTRPGMPRRQVSTNSSASGTSSS